MAADESLFKALEMFGQGMQKYQLQTSLNEANDVVSQIKQSNLSEAEQMKEIRGIANDLTVRLAGIGVNAASIEQVANAFKPPQPTQFEQGLLMKQLDFAQQNNAREDTQAFTGEQNDKARTNAMEIAKIGAASKDKNKERLGEKAVSDLNAIDTNSALIKSVLSFVDTKKASAGAKNVGILGKVYSRTDPDYAKLENKIIGLFNEHRKAVTGAAASEGEIAQLKAEFPSLVNSPGQFKSRLKSMLETNTIKRKTFLGSQRANRKDVSGFEAPGSAAPGYNPVFEQEFLPPGSSNDPSANPDANDYNKYF